MDEKYFKQFFLLAIPIMSISEQVRTENYG